MDWTGLDCALGCVAAVLAVIGLFRGFSGTLGTLAGMAAAVAVGTFSWSLSLSLAGRCASTPSAARLVAGVIDFAFSLVAFGLVRRLVSRFVSFLVHQPLNAILGALCGLLLASSVVAVLAAFGFVTGGRASGGFFAENSRAVAFAAGWLDALHGEAGDAGDAGGGDK